MPKDKMSVSFELERDHIQWLDTIVDQRGFKDISKVVRVLLDYAIQEADNEYIFAPENSRCLHCG